MQSRLQLASSIVHEPDLLFVDDADEELPGILETLHGVDVRSADLPKASFDEVFFRLVRDSEAKGSINAAG